MALLNQDDEMVERMEVDLATKARDAYTAAGLAPAVHGIFSLDDLEKKSEADLCQLLAVGIGYSGCEPRSNPMSPGPNGSSNAAKALDFTFTIILAVPTGAECIERYSATKLLTILRRGIMGSKVDGDLTNREWAFVREVPNIQESTDTMLYYSQVWRVALVQTGPR